MLTWIIVVITIMLSMTVYLFMMLEEDQDEHTYLQRKWQNLKLQNEDRNRKIQQLQEEILHRKQWIKNHVLAAKDFRNQIIELTEAMPSLEREAERWETFELTEQEAIRQYKKWKEERVKEC